MVESPFSMDIQIFLNKYGNIQTAQKKLQKKFSIDITPQELVFSNGNTETVWLYNYNKQKATGASKIENEAKGLILNSKHEVVSRSFVRFFDINTRYAAAIDWKTTHLEQKLDGSMVIAYGYKGELFFQTRSSATASNIVPGTKDLTFREAVINILKHKNVDNPFLPFTKRKNHLPRYSWVFEYIGPENKFITPYEESDLVCLAIISKELNAEVPTKFVDAWAKEFKMSRPDFFHGFENKNDTIIFAKSSSLPFEEGYVAIDNNNNRVKIKNPTYIQIAKAVDADSNVLPIAKLVLVGLAEEVAQHFDRLADILLLLDSVFWELLDEVDNIIHYNKNINSNKDFAAVFKKHKLSSILFKLWKGKIDSLENMCQSISPELLITETKKRYERNYYEAIKKCFDKQHL